MFYLIMSDENIIRVAKHIIIDNPEAELGDPLAEHGYDPLGIQGKLGPSILQDVIQRYKRDFSYITVYEEVFGKAALIRLELF